MLKKMLNRMMKSHLFIEELLQSPLQEAHQPMKMKALLVWMCFYMHGLVLKLLLPRQRLSQLTQTLLWAESPLDQQLMRFLSMLLSEGMLRCLMNMTVYKLSLMLSQGPLHGHLAR